MTMKNFERGCAAIGLEFRHLPSGATLGAQIKGERLRLRLGLRPLAERANISVGGLRRVESNEAHLGTAEKVLRVLVPKIRPRLIVKRAINARQTDIRLTPADFIEQLKLVLGPKIDLDPCAHPNSFVGAENNYYEADDGLSKPWFGTVFCNPPYSGWGPWLRKAHAHWMANEVDRVALLLPVRVGNSAFLDVGGDGHVIFLRRRITFYSQDGKPYTERAPFASMIVLYANEDVERAARSVWEGLHIPRRTDA
jgi:transcriptional regulator with XRE-family HTH domain